MPGAVTCPKSAFDIYGAWGVNSAHHILNGVLQIHAMSASHFENVYENKKRQEYIYCTLKQRAG